MISKITLVILLFGIGFWCRSLLESRSAIASYHESAGDLTQLKNAVAWSAPLNIWAQWAEKEFDRLLSIQQNPEDNRELLHLYYQGLFQSQSIYEGAERKQKREDVKDAYFKSLGSFTKIERIGMNNPALGRTALAGVAFLFFLLCTVRFIFLGFTDEGKRSEKTRILAGQLVVSISLFFLALYLV
jgi:hypothetical protein